MHVNDVGADSSRAVGDCPGGRAGPHGVCGQADLLGSRRPIRDLVVVDDEALDSMSVLGEQLGLGFEDGVLPTGLLLGHKARLRLLVGRALGLAPESLFPVR